MANHDDNTKQDMKKGKNILLSLLFVIIAVLCVYTVTSLNKSFSLSKFVDYLKSANYVWIIVAVIALIIYVLSEGAAINVIARSFGYKTKKSSGFIYSSADIYFSAITPSATGGQPASAYFMLKDGMSSAAVTAILLFNLLAYTVAFFIVSFVTFIFSINIFMELGLVSQMLIIIGFFVQLVLIVSFAFLLFKARLLYKLCKFFWGLLAKLHLIKNPQEKLKKLIDVMDKYNEYAKLLKYRTGVMFKALGFNIIQRICLFSITVFIFLSAYGTKSFDLSLVMSVWSIQCMVSIGANFIPIPGAMGISDVLLLDGFGTILTATEASNLELLTRVLSFYSCAIICGIAVLIKFIMLKKRSKK